MQFFWLLVRLNLCHSENILKKPRALIINFFLDFKKPLQKNLIFDLYNFSVARENYS